MENEYRVISNYTELDTFATAAEARAFAIDESYRFDDRVTIEKGSEVLFLAVRGGLFRVTPYRGR